MALCDGSPAGAVTANGQRLSSRGLAGNLDAIQAVFLEPVSLVSTYVYSVLPAAERDLGGGFGICDPSDHNQGA